MSTIENDQVMTATDDKTIKVWKKPIILITAIVILVLAAASVTGFFVWNHMQQLEQARIEQALREQQILEQKIEEERVRYEQARDEVLIDEFYEGISINGSSISGMTFDEAEKFLSREITKAKNDIEYSVYLGDQAWSYNAHELDVSHNLDELINEAWKIGRVSGMQDEKAQIYDRQQIIQSLAKEPVDLQVVFTYNKNKLAAALADLADEQTIEAVEAQVTGFDVSSKKFIVSQHSDGLDVSADSVIAAIDSDFAKGNYTGSYELHSEDRKSVV